MMSKGKAVIPAVPCRDGQVAPACVVVGSAPWFVTGVKHVCGRNR